MTDHNHFFVLLGRDISALLGIAEYLEMLGRDRVANLVRTVTFSIEQTVNDLRHDLLHLPRRNKPKLTARRVRRKRFGPDREARHGVDASSEADTAHR